MSFFSNRILPASGATLPQICAMRVVLPAPFGPMSAWTSPALTERLTASVATTPPKCFDRLRSSSMAAKQPGDPLRREQHDDEQHDPDAEAGVLLVVGRERR